MVSEWNEAAVRSLIGREESLRLEFKSGRFLERKEEQVAKDLSSIVSAFANSEGGLLLIGMAEQKNGKNRVVADVDGVPGYEWPGHRLQQILESNIYPPLTGIRVFRVPLSGFADERVAFVIEVPQGVTAYQARDYRYYGRSEFEIKPLRDLDVRLRMERGKAAAAEVFCSISLQRSANEISAEQIEDHRKNLSELIKETFESAGVKPDSDDIGAKTFDAVGGGGFPLVDVKNLSPRWRFSEYTVDFELRNVGERTIREFEVRIDVTATARYGVTLEPNVQPRGGFYSSDDIFRYRGARLHMTERDLTNQAPRLLPRDAIQVGRVIVLVPDTAPKPANVVAQWAVFLDNVLPRQGQQDLLATIHRSETKPTAVFV